MHVDTNEYIHLFVELKVQFNTFSLKPDSFMIKTKKNNLKLVQEVKMTEYYLMKREKKNRNTCLITTNQMIVIIQVLFFLVRHTYHLYFDNVFFPLYNIIN